MLHRFPCQWVCFAAIAARCFLTVQGADLDLDAPALDQLISAAAGYESGQSMAPLRRLEELVRQSSHDPNLRTNLESRLVILLTGRSTPEAKQFACQQLSMVATDASLPALEALLTKEETASLACKALGAHPSPKANDALRRSLTRLQGATRAQVVGVLGDRLDPESVGLLAELAGNPDLTVSEASITALGKIANAPARQAIANLRKTRRPELARVLDEASLNIAEKLAGAGDNLGAAAIYEDLLEPAEPDNVRRGALEALFRLDVDGGEKRVLEILHGTDALLKPVAIAAVNALRSDAASETFVRELPALQPQEQIWLIEILASRRDAASRSAVEKSLSSSHSAVRLAAIESLGKFGDASSVNPLCQGLQNAQDHKERSLLEKALSALPGGAETDEKLIDALKTSSAPAKVSLMSVLAKRGSRQAFPAILDETHSEDTAAAAFQSLASLARTEDLPVLLRKLQNLEIASARSDAEAAVAQALLVTDDRIRRSEAICDALRQTAEPEARCSLIRLLPNCGDDKAFEALDSARGDQNATVRDAAIRALAEWPDAIAWNSLAQIYEKPDNEPHRVLALGALVRLAGDQNAHPTAQLVAKYGTLLDHARNDEDRRLILGALGGLAHPDALKLAESLLTQPEVQAEAEAAVKQIAASLKKDH
jgi:HEAT repeat protein